MMVLSEHQPQALILSRRAMKTRFQSQLAPPASFTRPRARWTPFSMGTTTWERPIVQPLAQPERERQGARGGAHPCDDARRPR
jgi:hypothetical protein